jgi:NADH-quinone oxidoreductase subunit J
VTAPEIAAQAPAPPPSQVSNTQALGQILYTKYVYLFEAAGLILLVAMIGAIVLTLHHKRDVKRQSVVRQVERTRETGVEVVEVETGRGLT